MNMRDVLSLAHPSAPHLPTTARLLQQCVTVDDVRKIAHRRWPRGVRDYVEGAADNELALENNAAAYREHNLVSRILRDVDQVTTGTTLLGCDTSLPFALAPTGYTRMMHGAGEIAVARAAEQAGIPYTLSTMATTRIEDVAAATRGDLWFQLYIWKDRGIVQDLISRAATNGYRCLMVTVDTPVSGLRVRDTRNGFTVPPQLTPRTLAGMARHPAWCARMLAGPPVTFANITTTGATTPASIMELGLNQFDATVTWHDLEQIRDQWPGTLCIKGVLSAEDARHAAELGLDAVILSNHGGRQLNQAATPLTVLPRIRQAAPDSLDILIDSGVRSGTDIAVALALGATGVLIGRPYLYGLGAAGQAGVTRVLQILDAELRRTMQLLGVTSIDQLRSEGATHLLQGSGPAGSSRQVASIGQGVRASVGRRGAGG